MLRVLGELIVYKKDVETRVNVKEVQKHLQIILRDYWEKLEDLHYVFHVGDTVVTVFNLNNQDIVVPRFVSVIVVNVREIWIHDFDVVKVAHLEVEVLVHEMATVHHLDVLLDNAVDSDWVDAIQVFIYDEGISQHQVKPVLNKI